MGTYEWALMAKIFAAQARIAAMQAANQVRISQGLAIAYGEDQIMSEATEIEHLAEALHQRAR